MYTEQAKAYAPTSNQTPRTLTDPIGAQISYIEKVVAEALGRLNPITSELGCSQPEQPAVAVDGSGIPYRLGIILQGVQDVNARINRIGAVLGV